MNLNKHIKLLTKKRIEHSINDTEFEVLLMQFAKEYHNQQCNMHVVSQQRELLSWMKENHHLGKTEGQINELLLDYNFEKLNCG